MSSISVVIPLYNKEPHIAYAIESVLTQSLPPHEIIIVDDGSSDNGPSIVQNYLDDGVFFIRQSNQGESAARNAGVRAATSNYIAFLDADDWWLPNHLETLTNIIAFPAANLLSTSHLVHCGKYTYRATSSLKDNGLGTINDFFYVILRLV